MSIWDAVGDVVDDTPWSSEIHDSEMVGMPDVSGGHSIWSSAVETDGGGCKVVDKLQVAQGQDSSALESVLSVSVVGSAEKYGDPFEHDTDVCQVSKCMLCLLKRKLQAWISAAAEPHPLNPKREKLVWAAIVPKQWQRKCFGVGCVVCHLRMQDTNWSGSPWARFEVVPVNVAQLKQHRRQNSHKASLAHMFKMEVRTVQLPAMRVAGKTGPCKGASTVPALVFGPGAPQMLDWARVWAHGDKSTGSLKHQADIDALMLRHKVQYTRPVRRKMRWTMHEDLKDSWRLAFRNTKDAALFGDGKQFVGESLLFCLTEWDTLDLVYGSFGVCQLPRDFKQLKSEQMVSDITATLKAFCTPRMSNDSCFERPGIFDEECWNYVRCAFTSAFWDFCSTVQAAAKWTCGEHFDNVVNCTRDLTHEVRITFRDSAKHDPLINKIRHHFITKKHSFAKQVKYSEVTREKYRQKQEMVIKKFGGQAYGMTTVVTNLSYSGKDFNSEAESLQRIVMTAVASFTTCEDEALDASRQKAINSANQEILEEVSGEEALLLAGMYCDWQETCKWFRLETDHDLVDTALYRRFIDKMIETWETLFFRAEILSPDAKGSFTQAIIEQLKLNVVLISGKRAKVLGLTDDFSQVASFKSALQRIRNVCHVAKAQFELIFRKNGLARAVSVFDLERWIIVDTGIRRCATSADKVLANEYIDDLKDNHIVFCKTLQVAEYWQAFLATKDAALVLQVERKRKDDNFTKQQHHNLNCWKDALLERQARLNLLAEPAQFVERRKFSFYQTFTMSTTRNERFLLAASQHQKQSGSHLLPQHLQDATVVRKFGPQHLHELIVKKPDGKGDFILEPTAKLMRQHQIWIDVFGRRFAVKSVRHSKRKVKYGCKQQRAKSTTTLKAIKLKQKHVIANLNRLTKRRGRGDSQTGIAGKRLAHFRGDAKAVDQSSWTEQQRNLLKKVQRQIEPAMREQFLRMSGRKPFHEYAVAKNKLRAKQKAKDKQIDLNKQRTKRGETKVYLCNNFKEVYPGFVLPVRFTQVYIDIEANVFPVPYCAWLDSQIAPQRKQLLLAKLLGGRLVTKEWFDDCRCSPSVCWQPMCKQVIYGFHFSDGFKRDKPNLYLLMKDICSLVGSKLVDLSAADFARWQTLKSRKDSCACILNPDDLYNVVNSLAKIDLKLSDASRQVGLAMH